MCFYLFANRFEMFDVQDEALVFGLWLEDGFHWHTNGNFLRIDLVKAIYEIYAGENDEGDDLEWFPA